MAILATGVTKVSGKAADTSGEVVLTAADIQNVVSPVSAGGIIERGSNANGEYVKFADGTMICVPVTTADLFAVNIQNGSFYQGSDLVRQFPYVFSGVPTVTTQDGRGSPDNNLVFSNVRLVSNSSFNFRPIANSPSNSMVVYLGYIAFGRWK